ncbi:MAG: membrane protein insertase YidC, partial [Myxococcota bacterium]
FTAYFGVKKPSLLTRVDAGLEGAIDYTLFGGLNLAPLCTVLLWILGIIYSLTGSWGIAIIGLTILVKLVLFPLNQRSMKSMRALSALKPEMDKLREKYKGDQQRQNEEMIRLYREHNVNPAGGCLPLLLQMPIMFALYRALWASVDLYQQEFLWVSDLTTRDPFWILPLTLVAVMFIQQKTTPTTMDPAQQRVMLYMMPLMFGFFMAALPAGLCLYILANTVLTIAQQHLINRTIGPVGGPPSVQEAKA